MGQPFVGEIRMFGGSFAPAGWAMCQGQLMPISENDTLFNLIGTTYGGDGQETFGIPDLQGRLPNHQGTGSGLSTFVIGQKGGSETVTLNTQQMPVHNHTPMANNGLGTTASPSNAIFANCSSTNVNTYFAPFDSNQPQVALNNATIAPDGGSQPHSNIQPTLCLTYIISLFGVYPSPT
jgi:microcystin-dependent protein